MPTRMVGKAITLRDDPSGLIAQVRIAETELGRETLTLAHEGILDCSAGFKMLGDEWPAKAHRRVTKAFLHHIALTPDPAYEDARVLAVRGV